MFVQFYSVSNIAAGRKNVGRFADDMYKLPLFLFQYNLTGVDHVEVSASRFFDDENMHPQFLPG